MRDVTSYNEGVRTSRMALFEVLLLVEERTRNNRCKGKRFFRICICVHIMPFFCQIGSTRRKRPRPGLVRARGEIIAWVWLFFKVISWTLIHPKAHPSRTACSQVHLKPVGFQNALTLSASPYPGRKYAVTSASP